MHVRAEDRTTTTTHQGRHLRCPALMHRPRRATRMTKCPTRLHHSPLADRTLPSQHAAAHPRSAHSSLRVSRSLRTSLRSSHRVSFARHTTPPPAPILVRCPPRREKAGPRSRKIILRLRASARPLLARRQRAPLRGRCSGSQRQPRSTPSPLTSPRPRTMRRATRTHPRLRVPTCTRVRRNPRPRRAHQLGPPHPRFPASRRHFLQDRSAYMDGINQGEDVHGYVRTSTGSIFPLTPLRTETY
ncbi:hypothetical protein DFH09DRAFT_1124811 [Mycena vulgaris]|nr:hypothetical protein DFH09DRAFT_1124811 [Mycena vulgaris]